MKKKFALIGAAGYIAPRHMKAILDTGNEILTAYDPFDSVGVIDSYFPEAAFFTQFERFERHVDKLRREGMALDYLSICSPNYLHDSHIRFGLRNGADVICEKPLVLNPWNAEALMSLETETGRKVNSILQLRLHPSLIELKERLEKGGREKIYDIDLTYITGRGNWYYASWKGDVSKSGGIATNIGIHFFDMLTWLFGEVKTNIVHVHTHDRAAGYLEFSQAKVRWFLSISDNTLPDIVKSVGSSTYRSMTFDGEEINFSDGFENLHVYSYQEIFKGKGFSVSEAFNSIRIAYDVRNMKPVGLVGNYHPYAKLPLNSHPFLKK